MQGTLSVSVLMDSCMCAKFCILRLPARYETPMLLLAECPLGSEMCFSLRLTSCFFFQNFLLHECFFTFFDLRKEFKKSIQSEGDLNDLDLQAMADRILSNLSNVSFRSAADSKREREKQGVGFRIPRF